MKNVELLVIGGGPAGLCAAISAAEAGADVLLAERDEWLGGQLVKQTHMFFGSEKQHASVRGVDIGKLLVKKVEEYKNVEVMKNATVLGLYEDRVVTIQQDGNYVKVNPKSVIITTGASEKTLVFPNNDLPGVYGAGAVQTLMNVYGVKPGNKVLMVGAGNIGLIVSYQLMQAGVDVEAIVDASPNIGGYLVHASKIRRMGVPILTRHTVKEAIGKEALEAAVIWELDDKWQPIPGSEQKLDVDVMCISVGLTPLSELLWQIGCKMEFVGELGGFVPTRSDKLQTSLDGIFVAGDVAGVEEASSAMVEGSLAGLSASSYLGYKIDVVKELERDYLNQLNDLRSGPVGEKIRQGLAKALISEQAANPGQGS